MCVIVLFFFWGHQNKINNNNNNNKALRQAAGLQDQVTKLQNAVQTLEVQNADLKGSGEQYFREATEFQKVLKLKINNVCSLRAMRGGERERERERERGMGMNFLR